MMTRITGNYREAFLGGCVILTVLIVFEPLIAEPRLHADLEPSRTVAVLAVGGSGTFWAVGTLVVIQ